MASSFNCSLSDVSMFIAAQEQNRGYILVTAKVFLCMLWLGCFSMQVSD